MSRGLRRAPVLRCLFVWSAVTAATLLLLSVLRGDLAGGPTFGDVLAQVAAAALGGCALWFWLVTSVTAFDAARGARFRPVPGCPRLVRQALLGACGVALAAGIAPAHAADGAHTGAGLPPQPVTAAVTSLAPSGQVVVQSGDSLWALAERQLPDGASDADIDARWREIWRANQGVVGTDPDVILPGQALTMPEALR